MPGFDPRIRWPEMAEKAAIWKSMPPVEEIVGPTPGQILRRKIFGHRGLIIGGGILVGILFVALLAPLIAPHDPYAQSLGKRLIQPIWQPKGTWTYILGTDQLGRDYLSRLIYGAQISLLIGVATAVLFRPDRNHPGSIGGIFRGARGPGGYLPHYRAAQHPRHHRGPGHVQLVGDPCRWSSWSSGFLLWDRFAVVIRSATMQIRNMDYVKSAQAVGCSVFSILFREVLPNVFNQLVVIATLEMAHAILLEAALSFLGIGVQPRPPHGAL